jgi:guanylate kinase
MSKLIVFTAPSGAGKTTIVRHLLKNIPNLSFSTSATTRYQRQGEEHGKDYYFLTKEDFKQKIEQDAFVEWEEVYRDQYYGTLKSEVERLWGLKQHIIFDIDVKGARNVKSAYPQQTLTIFIKAPSLEALLDRLRNRNTEAPEQLARRMAKATEEAAFEDQFDYVLVNDDLTVALQEAEKVVSDFLAKA